MGSEMLGTSDSNTPNGSISPASSAAGSGLSHPDSPNSSPEETGPPLKLSAGLSTDEQDEQVSVVRVPSALRYMFPCNYGQGCLSKL